MAKLAKLLSSANGSTSGLDVDDVFSNYLYIGDNNTRTITNNIDFSGEGGLLWIQNRSQGGNFHLFDTERGSTKNLHSNTNDGDATSTTILTSFNSDGYSIGTGGNSTINNSGDDFVAWSWRKAPKFFDCFVYTGSSSGSQTISHNLGVAPAFVIIKRTDSNGDWGVYSAVGGSGSGDCSLKLNEPESELTPIAFSSTSTSITVFSSNFKIDANINGATYVAYLFANNNGDGEFGPTQDQDIIKCGTYTGAGASGPTVNLGFEPQWLLIKASGSTGDWYIFDTMRGLTASTEGYTDRTVYANLPNGEEARDYVNINQTGFKIVSSVISSSGTRYVYIAIRRGPLTAPRSSSNVFAIDTFGGTGGGVAPGFRSTSPIDMSLRKTITGTSENWELSQRQIQGTSLRPNDTDILDQGVGGALFDYMNGWNTGTSILSDAYSWMWKRAPGYFDALYYSGNNNSGRNITHNLGVVPEMIWVKAVDSADNWMVGTQSEGDAYTKLNDYDGFTSDTTRLRMTGNTAATFQVGNDGSVNSSSFNYVSYLFASKAGISKVGTYTGNGTSQNIDCGFSNGAKLIIIKSTGAASANWVLIDSQRGLSNEIYINLATAQGTSSNVTSYSGGFALTNTNHVSKNANGTDYIFYAIAAP